VALISCARWSRSSSYDTPASTRDPARFAFAHDGKDGTPFPVDRETYDRTIATLNAATLNSRDVDRGERVAALRRSPS
jgi:hypothetical protein